MPAGWPEIERQLCSVDRCITLISYQSFTPGKKFHLFPSCRRPLVSAKIDCFMHGSAGLGPDLLCYSVFFLPHPPCVV